MLPLSLGLGARKPFTLLCVGAHADDIEIGCGGTVLRLLEETSRVTVHWVVLTGDDRRALEARRSASRFLRRAWRHSLRVEGFRDGFLPFEGAAVKDAFERLKPLQPDLILTHFRDDAHQDHRTVCELTWNTWRDHTILEYEIPKFDGDLAHPNVFVPLSEPIRRRKVQLLMSVFPSQSGKRWYSPATFDGLMRVRGIECAAPEGYAEAFHGRKLLLR